MTDEIERLKQQHKEEMDLAQEVIVSLRRSLAHAHKSVESLDVIWNDALSSAADEIKYFMEKVWSLPNEAQLIDSTIARLKRP